MPRIDSPARVIARNVLVVVAVVLCLYLIYLLREPITRVLFERGRFTPDDTAATAAALAWYAIGLVGYSASRIAAQAFYAVGAPGVAVRMGILAVAANVVLAIGLIVAGRRGGDGLALLVDVGLMGPFAHGGLALASAVASYVNLVALVVAARRRFGRIGGREIARSVGRTALASVPLAAWCAAITVAWPRGASLVAEVTWLAVAIGGGGLLYGGASVLLRAPEVRTIGGILAPRRRTC